MTFWSSILNFIVYLSMRVADAAGVIRMDGSCLEMGSSGVYSTCWDSWVSCTVCHAAGPEEILVSLSGVGHYLDVLGFVPVTDEDGRKARLYLGKGTTERLVNYDQRLGSGPIYTQTCYLIEGMCYHDDPYTPIVRLTLSKESRESLNYVFTYKPAEILEG